jgi:hypothetical protein
VAIRTSEALLLKLDRYHEANEISVDISATRFEPCSVDVEHYRFASADCETISQDLNSIDWKSLFSCKKVDQCVDLFYDVIWRHFDRHIPKSRANRTGSIALGFERWSRFEEQSQLRRQEDEA